MTCRTLKKHRLKMEIMDPRVEKPNAVVILLLEETE
jgi:hypothetical protein